MTYEDSFHGHGSYWLDAEQSNYVGEWHFDKKQGKGREEFGDGAIYEGEFYDDAKQGKGKLTDPNYIYEGDFHEDHMQGFGVYKHLTGTNKYTYEGNWVKSRMNGKGKTTFED